MKLRVQIDNETYEVEVGDLTQRPILAVVDGETFEVYPEEIQAEVTAAPAAVASVAAKPAPRPAAQPAPTAVKTPPSSSAGSSNSLTAPIPGVILSVAVKVGDDVAPDQEICVLEAMKMKNTIRADRAGKVTAVHVSNGDTVKHGQALVDF
ncbi:MAG: biotin/lipoyl-containing protein [Anaerolineaceae bacterium]